MRQLSRVFKRRSCIIERELHIRVQLPKASLLCLKWRHQKRVAVPLRRERVDLERVAGDAAFELCAPGRADRHPHIVFHFRTDHEVRLALLGLLSSGAAFLLMAICATSLSPSTTAGARRINSMMGRAPVTIILILIE